MADLQLVRNPNGHGWADCRIADGHTDAEVAASYVTSTPEDLLQNEDGRA
ncbi:hypothetical protein [Streptomyces sp. NPDC058872]